MICDPKRNPLVQYAWGLGKATKKSAEAYFLWLGIKLAKEYGLQKLIIVGDSMIVIKAFINRSNPNLKDFP